MELIQLNSTDIKKYRDIILKEQDGICPISKVQLTPELSVLDHHHKFFKDQIIGEDGIGLCRGVIHRQVNVLEGKISNSYYRLGLHKLDLSLPELLRNLADYLEKEHYPYIHPTEKPKEEKLKKSVYNKLVKTLKASGYKKKIPEYPKSEKITKEIKILLDQHLNAL